MTDTKEDRPVSNRDPLLPKPVLIFLAVVVALGWLTVVVATLRDPSNSGPLLVVTGLLATVIGASFGITIGRKSDSSGDDKP